MYNLESFKKYSVTPSTSRNPQKPPTSPHPPPAPRALLPQLDPTPRLPSPVLHSVISSPFPDLARVAGT